MSRVVGIDITNRHVRAALLRVAYRKTFLDDLREVQREDFESIEQAVAACIQGLGEGPGGPSSSGAAPHRVDGSAVVLEGRRVFVHRLTIPTTALKQIDELLPFEIEAQVPVDMSELVFDYEIAPAKPGDTTLDVLTVAARTEHVRQRIALVAEALGREPERVSSGPVELGQLATIIPELAAAGPLVILDLGDESTDVCILEKGRVAAARSLSLGAGGFPDCAEPLVAQLRQTFGGYALMGGREVERVYLVGSGAALDGVHAFFSDRLGVAVEALPTSVTLEGTTPAHLRLMPRFARALGAAQHVASGRGIDLRQGSLAYQRGFGFLKEKAPLLMGLAAAVLISFVFATWSETRALDREREMLLARLEAESQAVLGTAIADPAEVEVLLRQALQKKAEDPMPHFGGLAVMVAVSEAVASDIVHDIEELDYQKGKVTLRGIVSATDEAQRIAKAIDEHRCIEGASISKITQVVNSDRSKYVLEANVKCPEDEGEKKKAQK